MGISRRNFILGSASTLLAAATIPSLSSCAKNTTTESGLKVSDFECNGVGKLNTGLQNIYTANEPTKLCVLTNKNKMEVCITNFGARIISIMAPNKYGELKDVCLGLRNIEEYAQIDKINNVFGAEVGRTIGRTSNAKFTLDGAEYNLDKNYKNTHNIHGGKYGWCYQTWKIQQLSSNSVALRIVSPDNDEGFPGEITYDLTYILTDENSLRLESKATTTKRTPLNVANHAYFNLEGNPSNDIFNYEIQIYAKKIVSVKEHACPDGALIDITNDNDLNFYTKPKKLKKNVNLNRDLWKYTKGYDFAYILDGNHYVNASVYCPESGIKLDVITDRPVLQLYDAHDLDETIKGKNNIFYKSCCAICLEAQTYCDAVNFDNFPNTILNPDQTYSSTTEYKFSVA